MKSQDILHPASSVSASSRSHQEALRVHVAPEQARVSPLAAAPSSVPLSTSQFLSFFTETNVEVEQIQLARGERGFGFTVAGVEESEDGSSSGCGIFVGFENAIVQFF